MIVYLDASSIVKLYIEEQGSDAVRNLRDQAENVLATSRVTYAEVRSAMARRYSDFPSERDYRRAVQDFNRDWRRCLQRIAVPEALVRLAGDLAERHKTHKLRGFDAVHLASALAVSRRVGGGVRLSAWDRRLLVAAGAEGLAKAHEEAAP